MIDLEALIKEVAVYADCALAASVAVSAALRAGPMPANSCPKAMPMSCTTPGT